MTFHAEIAQMQETPIARIAIMVITFSKGQLVSLAIQLDSGRTTALMSVPPVMQRVLHAMDQTVAIVLHVVPLNFLRFSKIYFGPFDFILKGLIHITSLQVPFVHRSISMYKILLIK